MRKTGKINTWGAGGCVFYASFSLMIKIVADLTTLARIHTKTMQLL